MKRFLAILCACSFSTGAKAQYVPEPSWAEIDLITEVFLEIQELSIQKRREYCGYIGVDHNGNLVATEAVPGDMASCLPIWPGNLRVVASYHTHGAFDLGYFNEVPSDVDVQGDMSLEIDGWVATPGGRLWFIDGKSGVSKLICGVACLPVSPRFYKSADGEIAKSYTLPELIIKLGGG